MTGLAWNPCHKKESLTLLRAPGPRGWRAQIPKTRTNHDQGKNINVMMPNYILLYSEIGDYANCHQRAFIHN